MKKKKTPLILMIVLLLLVLMILAILLGYQTSKKHTESFQDRKGEYLQWYQEPMGTEESSQVEEIITPYK